MLCSLAWRFWIFESLHIFHSKHLLMLLYFVFQDLLYCLWLPFGVEKKKSKLYIVAESRRIIKDISKYNAIYQTTCYNLLSHLISFAALLLSHIFHAIVIDFHLSWDERNHWHNQFNTHIHHQKKQPEWNRETKNSEKNLWAHFGWKLSSSTSS